MENRLTDRNHDLTPEGEAFLDSIQDDKACASMSVAVPGTESDHHAGATLHLDCAGACRFYIQDSNQPESMILELISHKMNMTVSMTNAQAVSLRDLLASFLKQRGIS